MENFERTTNAFNFVFEKNVPAGETVIVKMPQVSANKRGINDIGFAYEDGIELYGTLASCPDCQTAIWQKIEPYDDVNKTISFIKIVNTGDNAARVNIRALFN